uniref:Uncharacterized protein n=1 Tax=Steinernema glaseri TaxID=37863 RepID=A0A1I7XYN3_9BILA
MACDTTGLVAERRRPINAFPGPLEKENINNRARSAITTSTGLVHVEGPRAEDAEMSPEGWSSSQKETPPLKRF